MYTMHWFNYYIYYIITFVYSFLQPFKAEHTLTDDIEGTDISSPSLSTTLPHHPYPCPPLPSTPPNINCRSLILQPIWKEYIK